MVGRIVSGQQKYVRFISTNARPSELGFDRNDPSTVQKDKLPVLNEKGMVLHYALPHENFVWAVRSEPGVIGAFEKIYDSEDLIVSFDAINIQFPK